MIYPVLLVPGIDDNGLRFKKMRCAMAAAGFEALSVLEILPSDGSISFESMAEQVQAAVIQLQQHFSSQKIDIVAYSMGALAVRCFIANLDGGHFVRRLITIAAPHHGTLSAYFRRGIGVFQMRPGNPWLKRLNRPPQVPGEVQMFSFRSPLDLMVIPSTSSIMPRAVNRAFWVPFHPWTVSNTHVIKAVIETLKAD